MRVKKSYFPKSNNGDVLKLSTDNKKTIDKINRTDTKLTDEIKNKDKINEYAKIIHSMQKEYQNWKYQELFQQQRQVQQKENEEKLQKQCQKQGELYDKMQQRHLLIYKPEKRTHYYNDFEEYNKYSVNDYDDYDNYKNDEDNTGYDNDSYNIDENRYYYMRKKDIKSKQQQQQVKCGWKQIWRNT